MVEEFGKNFVERVRETWIFWNKLALNG